MEPRVVLFGPPLSGKTTLVPLIHGLSGEPLVHVRPGAIFADHRARGTNLGKRLDAFYESAPEGEIPGPEVFLQDLADHIKAIEKEGKGWILEKGPRLVSHFDAWREAGICPTHVVVLKVLPEIVVRRSCGRRVDPVTGISYNVEGFMPEDEVIRQRLVKRSDDVSEDVVKARLARFEKSRRPVIDLYGKQICQTFDTSSTPTEIAGRINEFLCGSVQGSMEGALERLRADLVRACEATVPARKDVSEAQDSLSRGPLSPLTPPGGTTGSFFAQTADKKWLIKSLRRSPASLDELPVAKKLLPLLWEHCDTAENGSLLPRFAAVVECEKPFQELRGNNAFVVFRNVNRGESSDQDRTVEDATVTADIKGFAQLYQRQVVQFFHIQQPTNHLTDVLSRDPIFRSVYTRDASFLASQNLVDWSLLVVKHRCTGGAPSTGRCYGVDAGLSVLEADRCEYTLAFIDILSEYVEPRISSSIERGKRFSLPSAKFEHYFEQMIALRELITDTSFCKILENSRMQNFVRKIALEGPNSAKAAKLASLLVSEANRLDDLISSRLIGTFVADRLRKADSDVHSSAVARDHMVRALSVQGRTLKSPLWERAEAVCAQADFDLIKSFVQRERVDPLFAYQNRPQRFKAEKKKCSLRVFFVRHGESENNANKPTGQDAPRLRDMDPKLTQKGHEQAFLVAKRLRAEIGQTGEVWCSPQLRCCETAQPIVKHLNAPLKIVIDLHECHGSFTKSRDDEGQPRITVNAGRSLAQIEQDHDFDVQEFVNFDGTSVSATDTGWFSGRSFESDAECVARASRVIALLHERAAMASAAENKTVDKAQLVLVSHGIFLSKLVSMLCDPTHGEDLSSSRLAGVTHYNCGVTIVDIAAGGTCVLEAVNSTVHLAGSKVLPREMGGGLV